MNHLVIGIGNSYRRDDGVGLAVAAEIAHLDLAGVRVLTSTGEPGEILDAWADAPRTVVVDAAFGEGATPGRIRRWTPGAEAAPAAVSSHALGLPATYALGQALGRVPRELVVFTVDAAEVGYGVTLTPHVAAAVPDAVDAIVSEIRR